MWRRAAVPLGYPLGACPRDSLVAGFALQAILARTPAVAWPAHTHPTRNGGCARTRPAPPFPSPPPPVRTLQDGRVRLWDMYAEAPLLLGHVPAPAAGAALAARAPPRPVSVLEFAWEQGLLITGHDGGEVRPRCSTAPAAGAAGAVRAGPGLRCSAYPVARGAHRLLLRLRSAPARTPHPPPHRRCACTNLATPRAPRRWCTLSPSAPRRPTQRAR